MSLTTSGKLTQLCLKHHPILFTAVRNHWNKDYKPGPFPRTEAERLAAAKKYGILPDEYKPMPNDGTGNGDYPDFAPQSGDSRDPFYPWDNPELKRNFGEVIHQDADAYGEDRYDINFRHRIPVYKQFLQFFCVMFGTFGIYYLLEDAKMFPALIPKQYPLQGKTHYTFEPNE